MKKKKFNPTGKRKDREPKQKALDARKVAEDSKEFEEPTGMKRRSSSSIAECPIVRKKRRETSEKRGKGIITTSTELSVCTWNLEKLGESTPEKYKQIKAKVVRQILDLYHPDLLVLQEVTVAEILRERTMNEPADLLVEELGPRRIAPKPKARKPSPPSLTIDKLWDQVEARAMEELKQDPPVGVEDLEEYMDADYVPSQEGEESEGEDSKDEGDGPPPELLPAEYRNLLEGYPLSNEYGFLPGAYFMAGKSYKEYYSVYYNRSRFAGPPAISIVEIETHEEQPYKEGTVLQYGGQKQKALEGRELAYRQLVLLRARCAPNFPRESSRTAYEKMDIQIADDPGREVVVGIIHTSPSTAAVGATVKAQVEEHLAAAGEINDEDKVPVLLAGDWYAQKYKILWKYLQDNETWNLVAPDKVTNFKEKEGSKGQTADHFVVSKDVEGIGRTLTISPDFPHALEEHDEDKNTEKALSRWLSKQVDHAPVLSSFNVTWTETDDS